VGGANNCQKSNGDYFGGMELISLVTSLDSTGRTVSNTEPENRGSGIGGDVKVEASLATVCFRVLILSLNKLDR